MPANAGTVGLLKAVLTSDVNGYVAGMKTAAQASDQVKKSVDGLEKETTKLTGQADRMVKAFGGDRLLYQANNLVAAVKKLEGASTLTEKELQRRIEALRILSSASRGSARVWCRSSG